MKYLGLLVAAGVSLCAESFHTGQAARAVIGQPRSTSNTPGTSATLLGGVGGVAYANGTLYVADSNRVNAGPQNNRVLVFSSLSSQLPAPEAQLTAMFDRCPVCTGSADVVLGQPDFEQSEWGRARDRMRTPTAVASDGRILAVADTDNNRVLIWNSIPTANQQPPDVVVGQPNFDTVNPSLGAAGLRGPQGVWVQNDRLYVADTQNHRVLIWNRIPTENGRPADLVIGKPDFDTEVPVDLTLTNLDPSASNLLNPVSVTADPQGRMFVADLGHNRIMVWNSTPAQNAQPADFALGQPSVSGEFRANNSLKLCSPSGLDSNGNVTFPRMCESTLNFPRFALSDGNRLFVADGGNDRVLIYNTMPTESGQPADVVLGQLNAEINTDSDPERYAAADQIRTPMSLAWDGTNLYVADVFNRRVLVYSMGDVVLPLTGVRNAASQDIFAVGAVTFNSQPKENDEVTLRVGDKEYKYKADADDKVEDVVRGLSEAVNAGAGDPLVFANPNVVTAQVLLTAKQGGAAGNEVTLALSFSAGAQLTGSVPATLSGGQNAAKIAPGTLVTILGEDMAQQVASAPPNDQLPFQLGGVEVYFDGMRAPLMFVSPRQINAQLPWDINDATSASAWLRIVGRDGSVSNTTAIAVPLVTANPGIFAAGETDPRPAIALHASGNASGVVSVDGSIKAGDVATVTVEDRQYQYTVREGDTLDSIRSALISEINNDEKVRAYASGQYTRIILEARVPGPQGEGIGYGASASSGANVIMTAFSDSLCCASQAGTPITEENPARPGEIIAVYATGLGFILPDEAKFALGNGTPYDGTPNYLSFPVDDAIAGGKTANVLSASMKEGAIGIYEVRLMLNADIPTNPLTQLTIAQGFYVSNIVTFPVVNPNTPEE
jgi:hypothetical protein